MKTADRILITSLALFNEFGEANVTSVDIANEMDISPGNLYYHFKGKEEIVKALFQSFDSRVKHILFRPGESTIEMKDFFYFLYLVIEQQHNFRFLYRTPSDLINKYPSISKGFKFIIRDMEKATAQLLDMYVDQGQLKLSACDKQHLIDLIVLLFTQSLNYYVLKGEDVNQDNVIHQCLASVFYAVSPYLTLPEQEVSMLKEEFGFDGK
ncbi:TetR/AcrR family transcriptional regulator [Algicola sagamiensis]|uniref:TetR/AcrR family transcriptional regulator n=1 Tax=Algicola sagamiensis TaxID=163869 RepID=UPI00035C3411|nr:TetR/AcrR family transcriptional regulator [Algicola sagamiensis]